MFRRSSLLVRLSLAFLLTTTLAAGAGVLQLALASSSTSRQAQRMSDESSAIGALGSIRADVDEVARIVTGYQVDVASNAGRDTHARQVAIAALTTALAKDEQAYQDYSKANGDLKSSEVSAIISQTDAALSAARAVLADPTIPYAQVAVLSERFGGMQQTLNAAIDGQSKAGVQGVTDRASELSTEVTVTRRKSIMLAGLAVAASVVLGLLFAELLHRSIVKIRHGAERIANGDFSRPIAVPSNDEIGLLADSFNTMAARLRESYARLALSRQRDETLLESMNEGLIAIDGDGAVVSLNSTAVHMLELPDRSELAGKPVEDVLVLRRKSDGPDTEIAPIQERPETKAFALGRPMTDIFTYARPSGTKIQISVGASPIILEGKNTGAVMIIRDVTHEQEVDRMKTEFISLASHQLRTPLSAIKWFTEMLVSGDAGQLTAEQMEFAKNVASSTERMIDLVNSLLNISRIESGRIMVEPKPTDLNELVNGIVNDLKAKIDGRHQTLIVSIHKDLPKINLDARLIGQVYLNLLTNAIKYTPKGGEVSVFVSRSGDQLVSQVSDNGYGIPKAEQSKMFQKFFRATNVSRIETDGTGLGLYLIKAVVESSGGKIWFQSEEGKGTTFWFSLPMSGMQPKAGEVTLDTQSL